MRNRSFRHTWPDLALRQRTAYEDALTATVAVRGLSDGELQELVDRLYPEADLRNELDIRVARGKLPLQ